MSDAWAVVQFPHEAAVRRMNMELKVAGLVLVLGLVMVVRSCQSQRPDVTKLASGLATEEIPKVSHDEQKQELRISFKENEPVRSYAITGVQFRGVELLKGSSRTLGSFVAGQSKSITLALPAHAMFEKNANLCLIERKTEWSNGFVAEGVIRVEGPFN